MVRYHRLELLRNSAGHLGFGHGIHQCSGRQLARIEIRTALTALISRFPTLRLAEPADEMVMHTGNSGISRMQRLPVTW
ncbi:cytochrome P450 [Nocardia sp. NPDC050193]